MGKWCGLNFTDGLRYNHINGSVLRIYIIVAEVTPNVIVWVQIQGMCLNCILLTTHSPASGRRQTTRKSSRYYSAPINWTGVNLLWLFSYRVKDPRGVCLGGDCPESRFSRSFRYSHLGLRRVFVVCSSTFTTGDTQPLSVCHGRNTGTRVSL